MSKAWKDYCEFVRIKDGTICVIFFANEEDNRNQIYTVKKLQSGEAWKISLSQFVWKIRKKHYKRISDQTEVEKAKELELLSNTDSIFKPDYRDQSRPSFQDALLNVIDEPEKEHPCFSNRSYYGNKNALSEIRKILGRDVIVRISRRFKNKFFLSAEKVDEE